MSTSQKTSNDLATVSNSAIYAAFLSVKQPLLSKGSTIYRILLSKGSTIYRMKGRMSVFYFCLPSNFPIRIAIEVWLLPIFSAIYFILFPSW